MSESLSKNYKNTTEWSMFICLLVRFFYHNFEFYLCCELYDVGGVVSNSGNDDDDGGGGGRGGSILRVKLKCENAHMV